MKRSFGYQDFRASGVGGLFYATDLDLSRVPMEWIQRWITLRVQYTRVASKLCESEDGKKKWEGHGDLQGHLNRAKELLEQARHSYRAEFEEDTFGDEESAYGELLAQIHDELFACAVITKMIERESIEAVVIE